MIEAKNSRFGIPYSYVWFAERPHAASSFRPVSYMNCAYLGPASGFLRTPKYTKIINLEDSPESILLNMSKNTAYEIRRAEREGVSLREVDSREEFLDFYNRFATAKSLPTIGAGQLGGWAEAMIGVAAVQDGETLVMHSYVIDPIASRTCRIYSASHFRHAADKGARRALGRANRLLNYKAMLYFKERQITKFDIGGYALHTNNTELMRVNEFKDGFGGVLVEESTFHSYPMYALRMAERLKNTMRNVGG